MTSREIKAEQIRAFAAWLRQEEKSDATIEKYIRDVRAFSVFAAAKEINKELVMDYKKHLVDSDYAVRSINSMLASINKLFSFLPSLGGLPGEKHLDPTADLLPGGKEPDQSGVSAPAEGI